MSHMMTLDVENYLRDTRDLTAAENGALINLLCDSWIRGPLPSDPEKLRRIAKVEKHSWPSVWRVLWVFFEESESGGFIHPALEIERVAQRERAA